MLVRTNILFASVYCKNLQWDLRTCADLLFSNLAQNLNLMVRMKLLFKQTNLNLIIKNASYLYLIYNNYFPDHYKKISDVAKTIQLLIIKNMLNFLS